ncbi:hypothetical protein BDBG_17698 [Blastomyces gilchristii SLH14081]|uniref:Uncharacterized protein n=1 Tax=Blastomyces gilchristii (strain SLH14081) TaxID=559298 RepID=A0A179V296_BLAGS|nr:uncharacterized protein BDBG_17698 [Blastomyces gilchristii SLH14081]OAT12732.1 hypothetical protein BDBG_17698 [Blastomyces gilchristii SLH14081]
MVPLNALASQPHLPPPHSVTVGPQRKPAGRLVWSHFILGMARPPPAFSMMLRRKPASCGRILQAEVSHRWRQGAMRWFSEYKMFCSQQPWMQFTKEKDEVAL